MIRWVFVIFLALLVMPVLLPWLNKLGIGRVPGDVHFKLFDKVWCLPLGSTLLISALAFLLAELL